MLTRGGERRARPPLQPIYDDFKPLEEWVQEPSNYILRLYLPQAFRKEDLKISYDQSGKITVRGTKQVGELKFSRFQSSYNVPQDSNFEKISGKLENNILSLTIPRVIKRKPFEDQKEEPIMEKKAKMVTEAMKEEDEATTAKKKPSVAVEERKEDAVIKEKKEELVMTEKVKMVTEARKEEDVATVAKKKPIMAEKERKEDAVIKEKKKEPVMEEKRKTITEAKKEEDEATVTKKKPSMAEEERKEDAVIKEKKEDPIIKETMQHINEKMKEEAMKTTTTMEERIAEAEHLPKLKEELQTAKKRDAEERKDEAILNGMKKASIIKEKSRCCQEAEAGEKKPEVKERRKRRWVWNEEEDKGWLDWMDSGFIEEVLKKVYKNKKYIALALVAFTTGYFVSRKLRRRG